jgi:hypothetical protein
MTVSLQMGEKKTTICINVIYTTQNLHKKWNLLHSLAAGHYSNCYGYENMMDTNTPAKVSDQWQSMKMKSN